MVVQHNLAAMNSNRMLGITTSTQSKSTEKLSSGYKINRAADDAAGLAISEKMRSQVRGLTQASANAQDGISAVQTAEGALTEVHDMLQRMNELATKSANGTNSQEERDYIQSEVNALIDEINRVSKTTKFNEIYLLKGAQDSNGTPAETPAVKQTVTMNDAAKKLSKKQIAVQAGHDAYGIGETTAVTASTPAGKKGKMELDTAAVTAKLDAGNKFYASSDGTAANYKEVKAANLSDYFTVDNTGAVTAKTGVTFGQAASDVAATGGAISGANVITATDAVALVKGSTEDVAAKTGSLDKYVEIAEDGKTLKYKDGQKLYKVAADDTTPHGTQVAEQEIDKDDLNTYFDLKGTPITKGENGDAYTDADARTYFDEYGVYKGGLFLDDGAGNSVEIGAEQIGKYFDYKREGGSAAGPALEFTLQVGAEGNEENTITVTIKAMSAAGIGIDGLKDTGVSTQEASQAAIDTIKDAIKVVSQQRSDLGAVQNRLEHTINNLDNVVENTAAAESAIRDTDMAEEMVRYSNNSILQQAGQSMLAQANQSNQGVLSLLG